jgi:hypothetical protein
VGVAAGDAFVPVPGDVPWPHAANNIRRETNSTRRR